MVCELEIMVSFLLMVSASLLYQRDVYPTTHFSHTRINWNVRFVLQKTETR